MASFLGVPSSWKTVIFGVLGILIIVIALLLRRDIASGALCLHLTEDKHTDSYRQNGVLREEKKTKTDETNETAAEATSHEEEEEKEHDRHTTEPQV